MSSLVSAPAPCPAALELLTGLAEDAILGRAGDVVILKASQWPPLPACLLQEVDGRSVCTRPGTARYAPAAQLPVEENLVAQAQRRLAMCGPTRRPAGHGRELAGLLMPGADRAGSLGLSGSWPSRRAAAWLPAAEEDRAMTITAPADAGPGRLTDRELQARITGPDARCVASVGDPDEWFPVTSEPTRARAQSAHALALCAACAVRTECLELALRCWGDAGQHGIWGGTLESQRRELHRQWLSGLSVAELLGRGS